jgi:hypothetical protein
MNRAARQKGRTAARAPGSLVLSRPLLSALVIGGVVFLLAAAGQPAAAQSIADHVASVDDGQVRFSFAAREGVCGDGDRISTHRETEDWEGPCDPGPARVAVDIEHGVVVDVDTYVGGRWLPREGSRDLGMVSVREAADYLLSLAETTSEDVSERAIFPASIADSVEVWPRLLRLAKDESRPKDARRAAVFWLSMIAADVAVEELGELVNDADSDLEIRKMALFGLSQLSDGQGVPALLDVARTHENRGMRKQAIFWLGQTDDPRAIALFEEILTSRR